MFNSLIEDIKRNFNFLILNYGFKIDEVRYDETDFGNAYVEYKNQDITIRIIRERGEYFMDINKNRTDEWFSFFYFIKLISPQELVSKNIDILSIQLSEHINQIIIQMNENNYNATSESLKRITSEYTSAMFKH
ncbi:MAG: hypothetical protein IPP74_11375 [Alphaproteobacteria bacterium]|nr:hypothetical protein [Alphaproteobacteria bacterium]